MNDYPAGLRLGRKPDRAFQTTDPTIRSSLESGRARQRLRYDHVPTAAAVEWVFATNGECQLFEAWFRSDQGAGNGAQWFDIPLWTALGLDTHRARFIGVYQGPKVIGPNQWQITATLELEERPTLPPEWVILPSFVLRPDIFDMAMNREWPEA